MVRPTIAAAAAAAAAAAVVGAVADESNLDVNYGRSRFVHENSSSARELLLFHRIKTLLRTYLE